MTTPETARLVHLVRHAEAVPRVAWAQPDGRRPLSAAGVRQSEAIGARLAPVPPGARPLRRVLSSPALRCRQTVQPTAARAGLEVEDRDELAEDSDPLLTLALLADAASLLSEGTALAACTHGDVIEGILETFAPAGVVVAGPLRAPKAVVWELSFENGRLSSARFVAPPPPGVPR